MPFKKGIERVEDPSRGEGAEPLPGLCGAQSEASEFSFSKKMKEHGKQQGDERKGIERVEDPSRGEGAEPLSGTGQSPERSKRVFIFEENERVRETARGRKKLEKDDGSDSGSSEGKPSSFAYGKTCAGRLGFTQTNEGAALAPFAPLFCRSLNEALALSLTGMIQ